MTTSENTIKILDQDVDDDGSGTFRIRVGGTVRYLNIEPGTFREDTMHHPSSLIPQLPALPGGSWTDMDIARDRSGRLASKTWTYSHDEMIPHRDSVEVVSLTTKEVIRAGVYEVYWDDRFARAALPPMRDGPARAAGVAVAKIACFHCDLPRIARETWVYTTLEKAYKEGALPRAIAPRFICHATENGQPMGVVLEKVEGGCAGVDDLQQCAAVVRQLHAVGIVHGDLNRHNFIVDRRQSETVVRLVDFERAEAFDAGKAAAELASLPAQLADESGRGGTFRMAVVE